MLENRASPCTIPFTNIYIDYNGAMVPCCDIRSDYDKHKNQILYTLTPESSLFDAYVSAKYADCRRHLMSFEPKGFPCNSCSRGVIPDTAETRAMFAGPIEMAKASAREMLAEPERLAG